MRRRHQPSALRRGFTLVEMLVSMALILFIMAILSEAFVASTKTFRDLKALGDMAAKLRGNTRSDFFFAAVPTVPTVSPILSLGTPDSRYQDSTSSNVYSCQWAELAFFLRQTTDNANGTPLYGLYMRQRLLVPENSAG